MRILWCSDAGTKTGFSRVTHAIGERMAQYGHEIHVLAIGYDGKDPYRGPLLLYRADAPVDVEIGGRQRRAQHAAGFSRVTELLDRVKPDLVFTLMDAPLLSALLTENPFDPEKKLIKGPPIVSYMPVDGYELPKSWANLVPLVRFVAMSQFGKEQLEELGATDVPVVYHGIDVAHFYPVDDEHPITLSNGVTVRSKAECRAQFEIPEDAFVVGRVDTNSGRKDWPASWKVVEGLFRLKNRPEEVMAVFHTKLNNPGHGVDLAALISKGTGKFMVTNGGDWTQSDLLALMNCWDVNLSTSRGEGFGLGLAEAAACSIPILATRCSAITEVVGPGGILVDPIESAFWANPYGVTQKLADTAAMTEQLAFLARNPAKRRELGARGRAHALTSFSWETATQQMLHVFEEVTGAEDALRLEQRSA